MLLTTARITRVQWAKQRCAVGDRAGYAGNMGGVGVVCAGDVEEAALCLEEAALCLEEAALCC